MLILTLNNENLINAEKCEKASLHEGWSAKQIAESIAHGAVYYFSEENGEYLGHAGMNCVFPEAYINNVAVNKKARRLGVGTALINKLCEVCENGNYEFLSLEVRESNTAAILLYQKCGFEKVGERKGFYRNPFENALIMTRKF